jgi:hypothetical protein
MFEYENISEAIIETSKYVLSVGKCSSPRNIKVREILVPSLQ